MNAAKANGIMIIDDGLKNQIVFWSPSVRWEKRSNDDLQIEIYKFSNYYSGLFPEFYYFTQKGISIDLLVERFNDWDRQKLTRFISILLQKRILVTSILSLQEIFYPQTNLFSNEYKDYLNYNEVELEKFKNEKLSRGHKYKERKSIPINPRDSLPEFIIKRKSYRTFDNSRQIDWNTFSLLLSVFGQIKNKNGVRYYYASAGGLYPIDIFLYVKKNKIENLLQGIYYYYPINGSLIEVNCNCEIDKTVHYYTNQEIFDNSAFSIYLIYNANVTMPKYGGMGYLYSLIDTGIMVSTLTTVSELCNIGLCSIGDMNFEEIRKLFLLDQTQVFIHGIEIGWKPLS